MPSNLKQFTRSALAFLFLIVVLASPPAMAVPLLKGAVAVLLAFHFSRLGVTGFKWLQDSPPSKCKKDCKVGFHRDSDKSPNEPLW